MFAVIKSGSKQYKLSVGEFFKAEKIEAEIGSKVTISDVLCVFDEKSGPKIGSPFVKGASIECEVLEQGKAPKVIIFKKKRRSNYRRKRGHRQQFTCLKVLSINS
jgi:large subunit ribosomal protein L21